MRVLDTPDCRNDGLSLVHESRMQEPLSYMLGFKTAKFQKLFVTASLHSVEFEGFVDPQFQGVA